MGPQPQQRLLPALPPPLMFLHQRRPADHLAGRSSSQRSAGLPAQAAVAVQHQHPNGVPVEPGAVHAVTFGSAGGHAPLVTEPHGASQAHRHSARREFPPGSGGGAHRGHRVLQGGPHVRRQQPHAVARVPPPWLPDNPT